MTQPGATMTVSEARRALAAVVERVRSGEEVTITRHGEAVAVIVRPDALRVRRAGRALERAAGVREALDDGRRRGLRRDSGLTEERADALVAEVRAARDAR